MTISTTNVAVFAVFWRVLTATTTRTFFQPDEFFQSLEVAHHAVFGYGHLTWEWLASPPIRSIVYPSLYMPLYWILKITGLDDSDALILLPKAFHGFLVAGTDIATYVLAKQLLGRQYADVAVFLSLTSFFNMLALGRTFSNSMETTFSSVALSLWPWDQRYRSRRTTFALIFIAISCMLRPTNAVLWSYLTVASVLYDPSPMKNALPFVRRILIIGLVALAIQICIDSLYFGRLSLTPVSFLVTNLSGVSLFYGNQPWHYYLTQALPLLCGPTLPIFLLGSYNIVSRRFIAGRSMNMLNVLIWWTIAVYSVAGHKEWRFLHPITPLIHIVSANHMIDSFHRRRSKNDDAAAIRFPLSRSIVLLVLTGMLPGFYVMYIHSNSQIAAMHYLRSLNDTEPHSIGFLMPCHSTPWQAYLHKPQLARDGYLWGIGCEPPLQGQKLSEYHDQTDVFYKSPLQYLKKHFPGEVDGSFPPSPKPTTNPGSKIMDVDDWDHRWPSHFVFFGALLSDINGGRSVETTLRTLGYSEVWAGKPSFEEDWRRRGGVRVWRWQPTG